MNTVAIFLVGVGLSMDAFAVSICKGLGMKELSLRHTFIIALFFGGFQALMPLLGWLLGAQFAELITAYDHYVAFTLLSLIGGKMIYDGCHESSQVEQECQCRLSYYELLLLAISTSIDALVVGVTMAFMRVNIWQAASIIGVTTFVFAIAGVVIGHVFGSRFEKQATITGGLILILIGLRVLVTDLGLLG